MECAFTYIKLDHSEYVEEHARQLLGRLSRFLDRPLKGHFTFSQERYNHRVVLTMTGKNMFFKSECLDENFYAAIENAVEKMCRQLEKKKSKMKNHKRKHAAKDYNNVIFLEEYRRSMESKRKIG